MVTIGNYEEDDGILTLVPVRNHRYDAEVEKLKLEVKAVENRIDVEQYLLATKV